MFLMSTLEQILTSRDRIDQGRAIRAIYDSHINSVRLLAIPGTRLGAELEEHNEMSLESHLAIYQGQARVPASSPHIPRPPNSFILYRQSHHQETTAANPGVPNTEICKPRIQMLHRNRANKLSARIIAKNWRKETPEVRAHFKSLADELRRRHEIEHPEYRYAPRRPNQIPRRTKIKMTEKFNFLGASNHGAQRIHQASNNDGMIYDLDTNFVEMLDEFDMLFGPQSCVPKLVTPNDDFEELVNDQVQRVPTEDIHFTPLNGTEFDPNFKLDNLLNLPGAT